jgi:hypothetical protein
MKSSRTGTRNLIFGAALSVAVAAGLAACGSSSSAKTNPTGGTNPTPAHTTPITQPPSSGGVSY